MTAYLIWVDRTYGPDSRAEAAQNSYHYIAPVLVLLFVTMLFSVILLTHRLK